MAFKTQSELWEYLLKGGKVKNKEWVNGSYCFLKDGYAETNSGSRVIYVFFNPQEWSIYEEPKPKKKVTLYRYTYREDNGPDIEQTSWCSYGFKEGYSHHFTLLKTETKEVEYDDV